MRSTTSTTIPFTLQSQSPNENVSCISSGEEDWGFNPSTSPSPSTSSLQSVVGPAELAAESALAFFAGSQNQNSLQINLNLSEPQSRSRSSSSGLPIIDYPPIPEVLPSAMLRFAASVCTTVLEPVKTMDSIVSIRPVYGDVISIVRSEQRKLLRRQRIGEAQRDLILALCYGDRKEKNDPENNNHKVESDSWQTSTQWSIVGAHIPIATMFVSWAETAISGWPMEKSQDAIQFVASNVTKADETLDKTQNEQMSPDQGTTSFKSEQVNLERNEDSKPPSDNGNEHSSQNLTKTNVSSDPSDSQNKIIENKVDAIDELEVSISWCELVNIGPLDWWYTLQVSRAMADLVTIGWRPPPLHNQFGTESVTGLLAIAERGLNLRFSIFGNPTDFKYASTATDQDARQERLAAVSSSAETMSALASLGSRGTIPTECLPLIVSCLCRLLATADSEMVSPPTFEDLYPFEDLDKSDLSDEDQRILEQNTYISQREACLSDTADFLWALIAHHTSASASVSILFELMDIDFSYLSSEMVADELLNSIFACSGAVRALGAALWGNPPEVTGVQSLRIYWGAAIEIFSKVSRSIYEHVSGNSNPSFFTNSVLVIVLEIAVSLRRIVDGEMVEGIGALTPHEWEALITALETGLFPWLDDCDCRNENSNLVDNDETNSFIGNYISLRQRISNEVCEICGQVKYFLSKYISTTSIDDTRYHHFIVDDTCRRHFHLMLLQEACPRLPPLLASNLAISVVQSWKSIGCFPYRGGSWCENSSELLAYTFAIYDDTNFGYQGGYVHSPEVSL